MLFAYSPQKDDELELLEGDYVFVSASDQGQTGGQRRRGGGEGGERQRERRKGREGGQREREEESEMEKERERETDMLEYMYHRGCVNS